MHRPHRQKCRQGRALFIYPPVTQNNKTVFLPDGGRCLLADFIQGLKKVLFVLDIKKHRNAFTLKTFFLDAPDSGQILVAKDRLFD